MFCLRCGNIITRRATEQIKISPLDGVRLLLKAKFHNFAHCKMVLVVRQDLNMSAGKIAAQCAHAAVSAYKSAAGTITLKAWELQGQPKVVVKCRDEKTLVELCERSQAAGLNSSLVKDAGRTELQPGTCTVLAVGPGPHNEVDLITGKLKLL